MANLSSIFKMLFNPGGVDASSQLSPKEAFQKLKGYDAPQLVDVRSAEERRQGYIAGSKLIPLHELDRRQGEINKTRPVIVYCRSGHRSGMALRLLKDKGFANVYHINGGIMGWAQNSLPMETKS